MIALGENKFIIERPDELPDFTRAKHLYLDFETVSFEPWRGALNPHKGDRVAGAAVTADDCPNSYYVPMRHYTLEGKWQHGNVAIQPAQRWLSDIIRTSENWTNANVKFDAHFAQYEGADFQNRLVCLTTAAKVFNSDMTYQGGYGLKNLSEKWLDKTITDLRDGVRGYLDQVRLPRNKKANDYGLVPIDIMARYACEDAFAARNLHRFIERCMPADCMDVWETETLLTPVLYDIEVEGMPVNLEQLQIAEVQIMQELIYIEETLHATLGFAMNPANSAHCYDLLCVHWGLPVLSYNDDNNPSFDKDALKMYTLHPDVVHDERRLLIIKTMQHYRTRNTLLTFFVRPYQEHEVNGLMHPDYNQAVRSGRMSCRRPNAQQLNKAAKSFILPGEGNAYLSCDYSQIEFRLIVHYTRAIDAINAYSADPDTDFHTWVAEMCRIPRKPAKNVNFAIGFGAGKKKVTSMLEGNLELMDPTITKGMSAEQFATYCRIRAVEVYELYNEALPGLKPTTRSAAQNAESNGYVFNAYGRRLHLPSTFAHIAFNRVVQSCAADIMKARTVAVAPRYNRETRDYGLRLAGSVHDETLFRGTTEATRNPEAIKHIVRTLEDVTPTRFPLSVPIRTSAGWSDKNWAIASGDDGALSRAHEYGAFTKDLVASGA